MTHRTLPDWDTLTFTFTEADAVEVFCTGTAWTLKSVREIAHRDRVVRLAPQQVRAQLWEIISGVQTGRREDPFGWTREVLPS